jgi:hypothetical protein
VGALARTGRWRRLLDVDVEAAYAQRTKWAEPGQEERVVALSDDPETTPFFKTD